MTGDAYRDGKLHVLSEKCSTCVFRAGDLMHLPPGTFKDKVEYNREHDTAFACHQTLSYGGYDVPGNAVCRGYFDAYGDELDRDDGDVVGQLRDRVCSDGLRCDDEDSADALGA